MNVPEQYKYTVDHEWISIEGDVATIGITDHAQEELTDIVYVELPEVDLECSAEETIAVVESTKVASDIFAPLSGTVTEVNEELESDASLINSGPYSEGWIFKMKISDPSEVEALMDASAYTAHISG